jgi:hypothetical protein
MAWHKKFYESGVWFVLDFLYFFFFFFYLNYGAFIFILIDIFINVINTTYDHRTKIKDRP